MTAQTSDRAQRIEKITKAITAWEGTRADDTMLATVLVDTLAPDTERLGGGERANVAAPELDPRISGWMDVCKTLDDVDPTWSTRYGTGDAAILAIRTLAQTAKDATARAEAAEAANMELDNARKSAEQSARDLRAENARLRAQLDAMTGEQVPYMTVLDHSKTERIPLYRHPAPSARVVKQLREMVQSMYDTFYADNGVPIEVMDDAEGMLLQISNMVSGLQRKAPAARVVGACVVREDGTYSLWACSTHQSQSECEDGARHYASNFGGVTHLALLGPALTPNADGAK